jgi:hypothetical protein
MVSYGTCSQNPCHPDRFKISSYGTRIPPDASTINAGVTHSKTNKRPIDSFRSSELKSLSRNTLVKSKKKGAALTTAKTLVPSWVNRKLEIPGIPMQQIIAGDKFLLFNSTQHTPKTIHKPPKPAKIASGQYPRKDLNACVHSSPKSVAATNLELIPFSFNQIDPARVMIRLVKKSKNALFL